MRKYITQHVPGTYLTFDQRQTLASDWNELVRAGCRVTLRKFAAKHGLRYETRANRVSNCKFQVKFSGIV